MKKKILILSLLSLVFGAYPAVAETRMMPYYSGDATFFMNRVIVATPNTGNCELFKLTGTKLEKMASIMPVWSNNPKTKEIMDVKFNKEDGRLYLYLVDGRHLLKYDVSDQTFPRKIKEIVDNGNDWFRGVEIVDGKAVTIGANGIKFWNKNLDVTNVFKLDFDSPENISFSQDGQYIFFIKKNRLQIISVRSRAIISDIGITSTAFQAKKIFAEGAGGNVYLVDNNSLQKYNLDGKLLKKFIHISRIGYDVSSIKNRNHIYFSDGAGIVKSDKNSLKPLKYAYTDTRPLSGGWAMGVSAVADGNKDKVVLFNNSAIVVMDENLKTIAYYKSNTPDYRPTESLYLKVDKNRAASGSEVSLHGGGFMQYEELKIEFAGIKYKIYTDIDGRFSKIITVPETKQNTSDISVEGLSSGLKYSLGFIIK